VETLLKITFLHVHSSELNMIFDFASPKIVFQFLILQQTSVLKFAHAIILQIVIPRLKDQSLVFVQFVEMNFKD
jgi:hypothetical protein